MSTSSLLAHIYEKATVPITLLKFELRILTLPHLLHRPSASRVFSIPNLPLPPQTLSPPYSILTPLQKKPNKNLQTPTPTHDTIASCPHTAAAAAPFLSHFSIQLIGAVAGRRDDRFFGFTPDFTAQHSVPTSLEKGALVSPSSRQVALSSAVVVMLMHEVFAYQMSDVCRG